MTKFISYQENFQIAISLQPDGINLLIFQTIIIWSKIIHSLKYLRSLTLKCKDIGKRKSEFVTKSQFLCRQIIFYTMLITPTFMIWWTGETKRSVNWSFLHLGSLLHHWNNINIIIYSRWRMYILKLDILQTKTSYINDSLKGFNSLL